MIFERGVEDFLEACGVNQWPLCREAVGWVRYKVYRCCVRDHVHRQLRAHPKLQGVLQVVPVSLHSVHPICCVFPCFNLPPFLCPGSITRRCSVTFHKDFWNVSLLFFNFSLTCKLKQFVFRSWYSWYCLSSVPHLYESPSASYS